MQMSRACLSSLVNKYRAVLRKCRLNEVAGTMVLGTMLAVGAGVAGPFVVQAAAADLVVAEDTTRDVAANETLTVNRLTMNGKMEVVPDGVLKLDSFVVGPKGNLHLDGGSMELGSDAKGWQDARVRVNVDDEEAANLGKVSIGDGGNLHLGTLTLDPRVGHEYRLGSEARSNIELKITLNKLVGERHQNNLNVNDTIFLGDDTTNGPTLNFRAQSMPSVSSEYVFMDQDLAIKKGKVVLGVGDANTQGIHKSRSEGNTIILGDSHNPVDKTKVKLEVAKGEWRVGDLVFNRGTVNIKQGATLGLYNAQLTIDRLEGVGSPVGYNATITVGEGNASGKSTRLRLLEDTTIKVGTLTDIANAQNKIVILQDGMLKMGDDKKLTFDVSGGNTMDVAGQVKTFNLDVKNGANLSNLTVNTGLLAVMGNLENTNGGINADTITVNSGLALGTADEGRGGTINAKLVTNGSGNITVEGSAWKLASGKEISIASSGTLQLVNGGSLDTSAGSLKVDGSAAKFETGVGTTLHISVTDLGTSSSAPDLNGNIKKQLTNKGTLKVTGTTLASATAFQTFRSTVTTGNGMITLVSQDANEWVTSNTTLAEVNTNMGGLDLTKSVVKANSTGTDALSDNVFVKQIDASGVTGNYTVTGGLLALTGAGAGEQLIKTSTPNAKVTVGNLQLGMGGATSGKQENLEVGTKLDVVGGSYTIGTLKTKETTLQAGANLHVGAMEATGNISVGTTSGAGTLTAESLKLGGNTLFADPAWVIGGVHNGDFGSRVALKDLQGTAKNEVDGIVIAGQASQISLRTTDTAILSSILQKSQSWGTDITAALYLHGPVKLDATNGAIYVNGALNGTPANPVPTIKNTAVFADRSLLVVNAASLGAEAAITGTIGSSTATVAAGSRLHLTNAVSGSEYTILNDFQNIAYTAGGFSGVGNLLQTVEVLDASSITNSLKVKVESQAASSVFTNLDNGLGNMLNEMNDRGLFHSDSDNTAYRFLSRAVDGRLTATEAEQTIEGAARMGVTGGAQQSAISASQAGVAASGTRLSMALPAPGQSKSTALHMDADSISADAGLNAGDGLKNGVGLWVMPLYQSMNSWGMSAGNFKSGLSGDMGGVALGADYTFNEALRLGVTFNIGAGYAKSNGDFSETDNSFNFWGVGLYGGWMQDNFGLSADVNYTSSYNKMQQDLPASMGMSNLKSDVQTQAISAGLRGEYKFETSVLDITPHIGVRYLNLGTDSYSIESAGQKVFKGEAIQQNIWTFPIGVTLGKTIESQSGWNFTPRVDLAVIPAAGDIEAKGKVKVPGLASSADLSTQVMDYVSYQGGVGFDLGKDGFSMGLNYTIQAGEHSTAHGLNATFRYEF